VDAQFATIRDGLERLRTAKPPPDVFGAESHGFKLNPPLSEAAVRRFEQKHRIQLPSDYRGFLTNLGNGGAGPCYGVFKLGEMDDSFDFTEWKEDGGFVGVLATPFPHTTEWNDLTGKPEEIEDEEAYDKALEAFDERYWNPANVHGAIPLCHEGCAYRDWLVVTGPEAGHMWHDARADQAGLWPIAIGRKKRVSFLEWYGNWLNEALAKLPKSKR
jgi:hypothetical protein